MVRVVSLKPLTERILLVKPDPDLREIVMAELLSAKFKLPLAACNFEELKAEVRAGTIVITLPSKLERVSAALGKKECSDGPQD